MPKWTHSPKWNEYAYFTMHTGRWVSTLDTTVIALKVYTWLAKAGDWRGLG